VTVCHGAQTVTSGENECLLAGFSEDAMATRCVSARSWWTLAAAIAVAPVAGLVATAWLPGTSAALVGALIFALVGLVAPVADNARTEIVGRARQRRDLVGQAVAVSVRGRLPKVSDSHDALAFGVHPSASYGNTRVPPYVSRDVGDDLHEALRRGGFVLLVGESTAGKSRAAYEAMRAVLADYTVVQPSNVDGLTALAPVISEQRRCVLWLDDLERFLGSGGLSSELLTRLLGDGTRHMVVLATIRTQEYARYSLGYEFDQDENSRRLWRSGRSVIERAQEINLQRRWSTTELARAHVYVADPRIAQAVGQAGRFGVAEVLAAGPELMIAVRNAWTPGQRPRGAALVTAAVDCRRAGVGGSLSLTLLGKIHSAYLTARGGVDLRPESMDAAIDFATAVVYATTSPLLPTGDGGYIAHDYLVDSLPANPIPDGTWQALLTDASNEATYDIGLAAYEQFRFDHARAAFSRISAQVPDARYMLGLATGSAGRPTEAIDILRLSLTESVDMTGADHPHTLNIRHSLAHWIGETGDVATSAKAFRDLVTDQDRILGPDHPLTFASRAALAYWTGQGGDLTTAITMLRDLLARDSVFEPDHPTIIGTRQTLARFTGRAGDPAAAVAAMKDLLDDSIRILGNEHWQTLGTRFGLAYWSGESGRPHAAVEGLQAVLASRTAIQGPHHPDTLYTRQALAHWIGESGDPTRAITALHTLLADDRVVLGDKHPDTLETRHELAHWTGESGASAEAAAALRTLLTDRIEALGPDHPDTQKTLQELARWADAAQPA
jgi:eukaryotic-like serine/threonine-protein kinase